MTWPYDGNQKTTKPQLPRRLGSGILLHHLDEARHLRKVNFLREVWSPFCWDRKK